MSLKIDRVQLEVVIKNDKSRQKMRELEDQAKGIRREMKKLTKGTEEYAAKEAELKKVIMRMDELYDQIGINGLSLKELTKRQRELNMMMRNMDPRTKEYKQLNDQYTKIGARMKELRTGAKQTGMSLGKMADGFNKYFGLISVWAASLTGVVLGFRKFINAANEFEEVADNTQALTKLSNENMEYFKKQSKETSTSVVEDNIRIKNSATKIMDAYSIMGSKRPELLGVKEDLHAVTVESMILSAAAKEELNPSVEALAISLNQFEYDADQARRVINVLAAGSQAGAGNIQYLNKAVEKSGTIFAIMNMEIEDNVAAIETLAPYYAKAETAGNSLDKVMLRMRKEQIGFKDGTFDLGRALDELNVRFNNGETAAGLFGDEHAKAAELLVKNRGKYHEFKAAVTDTNVAIEQATINTDNNNAKLAQARNRLELMSISLGEKLAPALTFSTNGVTYLLKGTMALVEWYKEWKGIIVPTVVAVVAYGTAVKVAANWTKIHYAYLVIAEGVTKAYAVATGVATGKIKLATIAQRAWNLAQKMNPIGLLIGVLAAVGTALYMYSKRVDEATAKQMELNKLTTQSKKSIAGQKVEMEELLRVAKNEKKSKEERLAAIKKLNALSPEYLGNLTLEKINTDEAKKSTDQYIASLEKEARTKAAKERLVEIEKELIDLRQEGKGAEVKWYQHLWNYTKAGGDVMRATAKSAETAMENYHNKENELLARKKSLLGEIDKETEIDSGSTPKIGSRKTVGNQVFEWDGTKWNLIETVGGDPKTQAQFAKLQQQLQDELARAGYANLKDGIEKETALENQRWIEEQAKLEERLITKQNLSTQEIEYNDNVHALIEEKKQAHLNRLAELEKAEEERKAAEKAIKEAAEAEARALEAETEEEEFQAKMELAQLRYDQELAAADGNRLKILKAKKKFEKEVNKIEDQSLNAKIQRLERERDIYVAKTNAASTALQALALIVGEETALGKVAFLAQKAFAIGQVWFNTAIANAKAVAASVITGGQPWVGINTAQAIASTALIAAQAITGLESGGYTDVVRAQDGKRYRAQYRTQRGFVDKPSVLVGEKPEFVANNEAVNNPTVKPFLDTIDYHQRMGTIHSLDLDGIMGTMPSMRGYESGGYTNKKTSDDIEFDPQDSYNDQLNQLLSKLNLSVDELNEILSNPLLAEVSFFDLEERKREAENLRNRS
jgi:TP901 family phage tail tape measure protein